MTMKEKRQRFQGSSVIGKKSAVMRRAAAFIIVIILIMASAVYNASRKKYSIEWEIDTEIAQESAKAYQSDFDVHPLYADSDEIIDTNRDENEDFALWKEEFYNNNLWEKEFYNCTETMMNSIEQEDINGILTPAEELERLERIEIYSASLLAYKSFVVNWVQREGRIRTSRFREDIFKQATLFMVLTADNYGGFSRVSYEFIYDHGSSREELLSAGNEALCMENVIDEGAKIIEEEFGEIDFWNERDVLMAAAWNAEFHNCMEKYAEMLVHENDDQVLRLWGDFVELWVENDALIEYIGGGSGIRYFMADRERECYRVATLLMIYQMKQSGLDYQFIYDIETDRDFLKKAYEWRKR